MEIAVALITALLAIIIGLLSFIGKKISDLLDKLISEVELNEKRQDVTDVAVSTLLKDSFSSRGIAEGKMEWPRIFRNRPLRDH